MKKTANLTRKQSAFFLLTIIILTAVVYSCKKDLHNTRQQDVSDPTIAQAKSWYESTYPASDSKMNTLATTSDGPDYSQLFKPDWKHTANYVRFNDDVVELPLDKATSTKLGIGLKSDAAGDPVYDQAYSHSSFLMLKRNGKYRSFIMTIIADPAYLKNDLSKLDRNKYNQRDSDFTGVVLYATPKGKFVNGWCYKNGKIIEHIAPGKVSDTTTTTGKRNSVQSIKTNMYSVTTCKTWLQISYVVGSSLPPTITELEKKCTTDYFDTDGGGSSTGTGSSGNGGAGGGGGASTSPDATSIPPCDQATPPSMESTRIVLNGNTSGGHNPTDPYNPTNPTGPTNPNDPNPGFPPPDDPGPAVSPCYVPVPDIIDSLAIKYPCAKRLISQLATFNSDIARLLFQAFDSQTDHNIIFKEGDAAYFAANPSEDGYTIYQPGTSNIYINPSVLANASNEYRLVTLYHEALHVYLDDEMHTLGETQFAAKYPAIKVVPRPNFSSSVIKQNDYYFDEGTTMAKVDPKHRTMADYFTQELRDAILAYNPSFPVDRATGLARGGIFLNDLSNKHFNDEEKDVRKGESAGTKCTP